MTVGGGIRTSNDIRALLKAGADKVSINTAAVQKPALIQEAAGRFGTQCIVVAIDAKRQSPSDSTHKQSWQVFTHGGRKPSGYDVIEWARTVKEYGAGEILLTSMDRDGTGKGYDLELTAAVSEAVTIPVIASGGAGNLNHLADGLKKGKADAVLVASIFHYGQHTIQEAKAYLHANDIPIRLNTAYQP